MRAAGRQLPPRPPYIYINLLVHIALHWWFSDIHNSFRSCSLWQSWRCSAIPFPFSSPFSSPSPSFPVSPHLTSSTPPHYGRPPCSCIQEGLFVPPFWLLVLCLSPHCFDESMATETVSFNQSFAHDGYCSRGTHVVWCMCTKSILPGFPISTSQSNSDLQVSLCSPSLLRFHSSRYTENQVTPFNFTTPDHETIYAWHVLPIGLYAKHESELLQQPSGHAEDITRMKAFELLRQDPEARLVINCECFFNVSRTVPNAT